MHRSVTENKKLAGCLFLSGLLHLAVVLLAPSTPDPQPTFQVVFHQPPRPLEMRVFEPTRPDLRERQMQRLVVKGAPLQLAQEPAESAPLGEIAEQLPPEVRDDMAHLEKRMRIEWSDYVKIDSLLLARMAAEDREDYVRFPLPNTGAGRDRALEVIERAIEAMGGEKRPFEALFDCRTALLAATREKLTPKEEQWFRQANPRVNPPTWITVYDRYQEVQGVLTPHFWKRAQGRNTISVYLQWAYNGAELSTAEPVR